MPYSKKKFYFTNTNALVQETPEEETINTPTTVSKAMGSIISPSPGNNEVSFLIHLVVVSEKAKQGGWILNHHPKVQQAIPSPSTLWC